MLECVINVSEGRDVALLAGLTRSVAGHLLDVHTDPDHHRSVFTLSSPEAARLLAARSVEILDITDHVGEHPRLGVVDVVPFVPLGDTTINDACAERDNFARWAAEELGVPCFLYGTVDDHQRTLPDLRRTAWRALEPDFGPSTPHPSAGAMCVGARPPLIAYNVWLESTDLVSARKIANLVRKPGLRTMAFHVDGRAQISMNIVDVDAVSIADAFDTVGACAQTFRIALHRAELVGLLPLSALERIDPSRWEQLDLGVAKTIEWRLNNL
jgi:glutamate formiminotransferase